MTITLAFGSGNGNRIDHFIGSNSLVVYQLVFYKPSYYFSLIGLAVNSIFQLIFMIILPLPLLR